MFLCTCTHSQVQHFLNEISAIARDRASAMAELRLKSMSSVQRLEVERS